MNFSFSRTKLSIISSVPDTNRTLSTLSERLENVVDNNQPVRKVKPMKLLKNRGHYWRSEHATVENMRHFKCLNKS